MASNKNLHTANREKNDEFYTQMVDIENELKHYKQYFEGKTVLCNCDDPFESNFFKYFAMNFNFLKLKKLIATCYDSSPIAHTQLSFFENVEFENKNRKAYKIEITEVQDYNNDGAVDLADVRYLLLNKKNTLTKLKGDGDFRSQECLEFLKQADIVVTNPPFSLFREYVAHLIDYNKKFLIIGGQNAITYKEIFPLLAKNLMWLGYNSGAQIFKVPNSFERDNTFIKDGVKFAKFGNICWFTNLPTTKRNENLILYKNYNEKDYPKYDNYDAINVDKVSDIPCDYYGVMGVPITFLDKYNPNQFEIVAFRKGNDGKDLVYSYTTDKMTGGGYEHLISGYSFEYVNSRNDKKCRGQNCRQNNICENNDKKKNVSITFLYDDVIRPILGGVKLYRRITIRRKKNEN